MKVLKFIFLIMICGACIPEETSKPPNQFFEKVWESRFLEDGYDFHGEPLVYNEFLIIIPYVGFDPNTYEFAIYDKNNGEKLTEWNHPGGRKDMLNGIIFDDHIILLSTHSVFSVNLVTSEVNWEVEYPASTRIHGGHFEESNFFLISALSSSTDNPSNRDLAELIEIDLFTGEERVIYSETRKPGKDLNMSPHVPSSFVSNSNVKNLVFQMSYWEDTFGPAETLPDLVSFNYENGDINWRNIDFCEIGSGGKPIVIGNRVYHYGDWSVYCFDSNTGELIWRTEVYAEQPVGIFTSTNMIQYENYLYCLSKGGHLFKINAQSGKLVRAFYNVAPSSSRNPLVNDGKIFYSSFGTQRIHIFDIDKDEFVHHEPYTSFGEDIVYDAEVDLYYTVTDTHLHAFRIND